MRVPPPHHQHCACVDTSSATPVISQQAQCQCQCLCSRVGASLAWLKPSHTERNNITLICVLFLILYILDEAVFPRMEQDVTKDYRRWGMSTGPTPDSDVVTLLTAILNHALANLSLC